MKSGRAVEALRALSEGRDPGLSAEEADELVMMGFVARIDAYTRAALAQRAAGLEEVQARVRDLRRQLDLAWGPRAGNGLLSSASRTALTSAQIALREATLDLEARSLARSSIEGAVLDRASGNSFSVTLGGRQGLSDLETWMDRAPEDDVGSLCARVDGLRHRADALVGEAAAALDLLEDGMTPAAARQANSYGWRTSALLASASPTLRSESSSGAALRIRFVVDHLPSGPLSPADRLTAATLLVMNSPPAEASRSVYANFLAEVNVIPALAAAPPGPRELLGAALADLIRRDPAGLLARLRALAYACGPMSPLALVPLARSRFSPEEAAGRRRQGIAAFTALGYPGDESVDLAGSLLASSDWPEATFAPRVAALDPVLRGELLSAVVADALLAALPLTTAQALQLRGYGIAAVSRNLYFDETFEVDYLALLCGVLLATCGSVDAAFLPPPSVDSPPPPPETGYDRAVGSYPVAPPPPPPPQVPAGAGFAGYAAALPTAGVALLPALFLVQSHSLYQTYLTYAREHPAHANAVPIYG
jgi:hypothetical protein